MLLSQRAGANSIAFLGGWVLGVTGAAIILLAIYRAFADNRSSRRRRLV